MIEQGSTHAYSSPSPHPGLSSLAGEANVDMAVCFPFDGATPSPPSSAGDPRRPPLRAPHPSEVLRCPRCDSLDTKFCYYNNYRLTQPRYFCKNCMRYWTAGGALRNVPVGGGLRKSKRFKLGLAADADPAVAAAQALVAGGAQQQQTDGPTGTVATKEVGPTANNRAAIGQPSQVGVGIPELGMYPCHPSNGSSMAQYSETVQRNGGGATDLADARFFGNDKLTGGLDFSGEHGHAPQFYSDYSANLPVPCGNPMSAARATGYAVNHSSLPSTGTVIAEALSRDDHSQMSGDGVNESKHAEAVNNHDWQLVSEGLFNNGGGASYGDFYYMPNSSWPDFPQFNDAGAG